MRVQKKVDETVAAVNAVLDKSVPEMNRMLGERDVDGSTGGSRSPERDGGDQGGGVLRIRINIIAIITRSRHTTTATARAPQRRPLPPRGSRRRQRRRQQAALAPHAAREVSGQLGRHLPRRSGRDLREALRTEAPLGVEERSRHVRRHPPPRNILRGDGGFEETAVRLWKRLEREEKIAAAERFFAEPAQEVYGSALGAIVKARHLRPQVARSMSPEEQGRALASVLDPGEPVAAALLVALHLGARRAMLDRLPRRDRPPARGRPPQGRGRRGHAGRRALRAGLDALKARFTAHEIRTYLNTLWLQDPDRWDGLRALPEPA